MNSNGQMVFPDHGAGSTKELVFGNQGANDWAIEKWNGGLNFWKLNGTGAGDNKLFLNQYGNVGINSKGTSTDKLFIEGNTRISGGFTTISGIMNVNGYSKFDGVVTVNQISVYSDKRIKENIHGIGSPLIKLTRLRGVQYDLRKSFMSDSSARTHHKNRDIRKDNIGFLAQDLQMVYPELVEEEDSTGLLSINYIGLIPVLVEALKEQQVQIAMLQQQVAVLAKDNNSTTKGKSSLKSGESNATETVTSATTDANDNITLYQNTPNPFSAVTEIKMDLPKSVSDARLAVYNLAGEQKLSLPIAERGLASVRIEDSQLMPGIYIYGIIADGQLAASKQMVVTE